MWARVERVVVVRLERGGVLRLDSTIAHVLNVARGDRPLKVLGRRRHRLPLVPGLERFALLPQLLALLEVYPEGGTAVLPPADVAYHRDGAAGLLLAPGALARHRGVEHFNFILACVFYGTGTLVYSIF